MTHVARKGRYTIWPIYSSEGLRIVGNSFGYCGNNPARFTEHSPDDVKKIAHMDYNNYATQMRPQAPDAVFDSVEPSLKYTGQSGSKTIFLVNDQRYMTLAVWQAYLEQDAHSIFADPKWIDPTKGNWNLLPDSPNLNAGPDGSPIGVAGLPAK